MLAKCVFIMFVVSPLSMTIADVPGQYGVSNCPMVTFSGSAWSPGCALSGDARRIAPAHPHGLQNGQRTLCIFGVFFSLSTRDTSNKVTILKLIYYFKQNRATAPLATPLGRSPACYIGLIRLIHSVGGANVSPWWWWLGVVLCFKNAKKTYYSYVEILRSDSFWFPPESK